MSSTRPDFSKYGFSVTKFSPPFAKVGQKKEALRPFYFPSDLSVFLESFSFLKDKYTLLPDEVGEVKSTRRVLEGVLVVVSKDHRYQKTKNLTFLLPKFGFELCYIHRG